MSRFLVYPFLIAVVFAGLFTPQASAQKKKLEIVMKWSGSVADDKLMKPECITTAVGLKNLWNTWGAKGKVPEVDFTKNIVVVVYSAGSNLNLAGANLDDKGNLAVLGFGTRDFRPGFRYVLAAVSKDGVKTVNGKALPKE